MKYLTRGLRGWSSTIQVARENAVHFSNLADQDPFLVSFLSFFSLAAARAPPFPVHLGIFLVVDKELGLLRECRRLAVLLAFSGRVEFLDSITVLQRVSVGTPVLGVLLNVAFLGCKMKVILGNVYVFVLIASVILQYVNVLNKVLRAVNTPKP